MGAARSSPQAGVSRSLPGSSHFKLNFCRTSKSIWCDTWVGGRAVKLSVYGMAPVSTGYVGGGFCGGAKAELVQTEEEAISSAPFFPLCKHALLPFERKASFCRGRQPALSVRGKTGMLRRTDTYHPHPRAQVTMSFCENPLSFKVLFCLRPGPGFAEVVRDAE